MTTNIYEMSTRLAEEASKELETLLDNESIEDKGPIERALGKLRDIILINGNIPHIRPDL